MNTELTRLIQRSIFGVLTLALLLPIQFAVADDIKETQGFRKHVTLAGIREHQAALQAIADANGGSRVSSSVAYDASAQYVYDQMSAAGYNVNFQEFTFNFDGDQTAPALEQISPAPTIYVDGVDYDSTQFSGSEDFTDPLTAVDLLVPRYATNAS